MNTLASAKRWISLQQCNFSYKKKKKKLNKVTSNQTWTDWFHILSKPNSFTHPRIHGAIQQGEERESHKSVMSQSLHWVTWCKRRYARGGHWVKAWRDSFLWNLPLEDTSDHLLPVVYLRGIRWPVQQISLKIKIIACLARQGRKWVSRKLSKRF